ncbi:MAG TPA: C39 family peptidase [Candidatus Paceibacterota bacterium]
MKRTLSAAVVVGVGVIGLGFLPNEGQTETITRVVRGEARVEAQTRFLDEAASAASRTPSHAAIVDVIAQAKPEEDIPTVPFYSQFKDISSPKWQGVGCGIASLAMLIDYYSDQSVSADSLLAKGVAANAFLKDAGWTHAGLVGLANGYGLDGSIVSLGHLSMSEAFTALEEELEAGPVMVSVHYTFEPTNPIPHLVVITGVKDGSVYYNDPAETQGGGSISVSKFQNSWKKRYIAIRPQ